MLGETTIALIILALLLAVLAAVSRIRPFFLLVVGKDDMRESALDGLRGLLALSVFAHHCVAVRSLSENGGWSGTDEHLANLMGQGAVAVFFMISAYLFLGKIFASGGRLNVSRFVWGRVTRLAPLYLFAVLLALVVVAVLSRFELRVSFLELAKTLPAWFGFGFMQRLDLNAVAFSRLMISPVWSLRYEWILYALLPVAAWSLRHGAQPYHIIAGFFVLGLFNPWYCYFGLGGLAYLIQQRRLVTIGHAGTIAAVIALTAAAFVSRSAVAPPVIALFFVVFVLSLTSPPFASLLSSRALVLAGHASYSIYLLHFPVLFALSFGLLGPSTIASMSDPVFLGTMVLAGIAMLAISFAAYLSIERPGMEFRRPPRPEINSRATSQNREMTVD